MNQNESLPTLLKHIIHYAMPISATNLLGVIPTFFITMMLGKLGKPELAAFSIANISYITLRAFTVASLYSVSILIGKFHASGDKEMVANTLVSGFWLCLILGLPATLILWHGSQILSLLNQPPEVVALTVNFFHYAAFTIVPTMLCAAMGQFYNGIGKPLMSTIFSFVNLPLVIAISYTLILGPANMGLAGSSCAFLIAQLIVLVMAVIYMRFSFAWQYLFLNPVKVYEWKLIKQVYTIGIHIGLQFLGELGAITASTYLMGYLGIIALASAQIVSQYTIFIVMLTMGIAQALSILTAASRGRGHQHLIEPYLRAAFILVIIVFALFAAMVFIMPLQLMALFINVHDPNNTGLIHLTYWLLVLSIPILFIDAIRNLLTNVLRGMENSKFPMLIGIVGLWFIGIPACYIFGIVLHYGPIGLRIGFGSGFIVAAAILWPYYKRYSKTNIMQETLKNAVEG